MEIHLLGEIISESFTFTLLLCGPNDKGKGKANPQDLENSENDQNPQNSDDLSDTSSDEDEEAAVEAALLESLRESDKNLIGNSSNTKVEDLKPNTSRNNGGDRLFAPGSYLRKALIKSSIFDSFYSEQLDLIDASETEPVENKEKQPKVQKNITTSQLHALESFIKKVLNLFRHDQRNNSNTTEKNGSGSKKDQNNNDDNSDDGDIGGGE